MFPQRLDSPQAYDIAKAMMDGFNRHYRLFRTESARAKHRFETADWHGQQRAQRERIEFYDLRVKECTMRLEKEFQAGAQPMDVWHQIKLHYIGLLVNHHQPELAETFFNSVTTKILHRTHFHNDFIFVRPAVSTEYIENEETARPTYWAYYPSRETLRGTLTQLIHNFRLQREFADLPGDVAQVLAGLARNDGHVVRKRRMVDGVHARCHAGPGGCLLRQLHDERGMRALLADRGTVLAVKRDVEHAVAEFRRQLGLQLQALAHARLDAAVVVAHRQGTGHGLGAEQDLSGVGHGGSHRGLAGCAGEV